MSNEILTGARAFIEREGRLIERRLIGVMFDDSDPSGVVDAVRAYRNLDGGFGHGLEPDKRCPASLPIDVECALDILLLVGWRGVERFNSLGLYNLVQGACDWLGSVAAADGAVPLSFPVMEHYPRAEHWSDWAYTPGLNPTAGPCRTAACPRRLARLARPRHRLDLGAPGVRVRRGRPRPV